MEISTPRDQVRDQTRDDRILPETRVGSVFVLAAAFSAFVVLYFWPEDTATLFAWNIQPGLSAIVMGAGYSSGAYLTLRAVLGSRWHRVALIFLPVTAFAAAVLFATVLHWDRFNHGHPWFYTWVVVYTLLPFLYGALWYRNRHADPGDPEPGDVVVPGPVRWIFAAAGVYGIALGLLLLALPQVAMAIWPWSLTPLTSRVLGAFNILFGAGSLVLTRESRWSAWRHPAEGSLIFSALLLIGLVRGWDDMNASNPLAWAYVAIALVSLVGIVALYVVLEARRRRQVRSAAS
jgi:hypothetical protein